MMKDNPTQKSSKPAEDSVDSSEAKISELALALTSFVKEYGFRGLAKNMIDCFGFQGSYDCAKEPL